MDELQLGIAAREAAPYLDWVVSTDGDGQLGTGMPFAGATVGTALGAATVCLAWVGGKWIGELTQHVGTVRAGGVERTLVMQSTGCDTALAAWESLLEIADAAASLREGLKVAEEATPASSTQRMNAIGLVGLGEL
jgi:hypothetical protein